MEPRPHAGSPASLRGDVHIVSENGREVFGGGGLSCQRRGNDGDGQCAVINTKDTDVDTLIGVKLIINLRNGTSRIFGAPKGTKNNDKTGRKAVEERIQLKPGGAR